jgi:chromosome condensin MukBEF MukE localization factor
MLTDISNRSPKLQLGRDKLAEDSREGIREAGRGVVLCWFFGVTVRMRKLLFSIDVFIFAADDRLARMVAARWDE